jgi:hypothetical protein
MSEAVQRGAIHPGWWRRMRERWRAAWVRGDLIELRMDADTSRGRSQAQLSRVRHGVFPPGGYGV